MKIGVLLTEASCTLNQNILENNRTINHGVCSNNTALAKGKQSLDQEAQTEGHYTPQSGTANTDGKWTIWGHSLRGESDTLTAAEYSTDDVSGEDGPAKGSTLYATPAASSKASPTRPSC